MLYSSLSTVKAVEFKNTAAVSVAAWPTLQNGAVMRTLSHCFRTAASGSFLPLKSLGISALSCKFCRKDSVDATSESHGGATPHGDFMVLEGRY